MTEKRPLTSYDQMFGWQAAKRLLVAFAVFIMALFVIFVMIASS